MSESLWPHRPQASLSLTISRSLPKNMSIDSVMPTNHLTLFFFFCPLLLLPPVLPSIRVFFHWVSCWHQVAKVLEWLMHSFPCRFINLFEHLELFVVCSVCSVTICWMNEPVNEWVSHRARGWGEKVDPNRNDGKMSSSLMLEIYLAPQWQQWKIEMASERELSEKNSACEWVARKDSWMAACFHMSSVAVWKPRFRKGKESAFSWDLKKMAGNFTKGRPRGIRSSCGENSLSDPS